MKVLWLFVLLTVYLKAYSHGGDSGPSTLEQEFSKMAHLHLPINYSTSDGFYWGYEIGKLENGLSIESHPIAFVGYDKIIHKVCLTESFDREIEICPENSNYLLLENKKWDLGLGGEAHIHLPIPGVGLGMGLSYFKGKNYYSYRLLNNKNEMRDQLQLPLNQQEFKNWRVGDQLFYMAKGTLVLNAFIGYEPLIHLGPQISRTGVHRVLLRKTSENTLVAEIGSLHSKDFSFETYGLIIGQELNVGKGNSHFFTYELNMGDEATYAILAQFLSGRIDLVNQSVRENPALVVLKKMDTQNQGRSISANFGFPVLFTNGGYHGTYSSQGTMDELEEGELHHHNIYTISKIQDHFTRGIFSKHFWKNKMLSSTILREEDNPNESILSVVLNLTLSRDKIRSSMFNRKMRKISQHLGLAELARVKLPPEAQGYIKSELSISLSAQHILPLLSADQKTKLELLQNKKNYNKMNKLLLSYLEDYFQDEVHIANLFKQYPPKVELRLEGENLKKMVINF